MRRTSSGGAVLALFVILLCVMACGLAAGIVVVALRRQTDGAVASSPSAADTLATAVRQAFAPAAPAKPKPTQPPPRGTIIASKTWPDVAVEFSSPRVGTVEVRGVFNASESSKEHLLVRITVTNISSVKKLDYQGSAHPGFLSGGCVTDELGNRYRQVSFGMLARADGQQFGESLYPGQSITDLWVFERPVDAATTLTMRLDNEVIGAEKDFTATFANPATSAGKR